MSQLRKTLIKRIPSQINRQKDITSYGLDNLYPQMIDEIGKRSPSVKACTDNLAVFLEGESWEENGDIVVNRHGDTMSDLLRLISIDKSKYKGYAVHINVDELGGITELTHVAFEDVRFSKVDDWGRHDSVKININWEENYDELGRRKKEIFEYPLWNKKDEFEIEDIEEFEGFIMYWTPQSDVYPECTFDVVLDSAQAEFEIQTLDLSSIQNGFHGLTLLKVPAGIDSQDLQMLQSDWRSLTSPENSNSTIILEVDESQLNQPVTESLSSDSLDGRYEKTIEKIENRIIGSFGVSKAVLGIESDKGLFTTEEKEEEHIAYTKRTRQDRVNISTPINKLTELWHTGGFEVGKIIEASFRIEETTEGLIEMNPIEGGEITEDQNQKETSYNGAQISSALDIINRVTIGELTDEQGVTALTEFLRLSEEVARELLSK